MYRFILSTKITVKTVETIFRSRIPEIYNQIITDRKKKNMI